jgi:membrane protease YdiL (CAAX protease family)
LQEEMHVPIWTALLASVYGGIAEEVLMRLFVLTLFVWLISKINRTEKGLLANWNVWVAIILSSVLFGLGHLPMTSALTDITVMVIVRAVLLNGIGGVIFGWLYWKKGLVSAMIAHFSADIVLHVITPIVTRMFI